mmetsp:Transcript_26345/g.53363  ORF Transcript_26345/g.53363 Transcript_26345/m.53363 type:complete len:136 (+) Transcript_26345:71-478(+)
MVAGAVGSSKSRRLGQRVVLARILALASLLLLAWAAASPAWTSLAGRRAPAVQSSAPVAGASTVARRAGPEGPAGAAKGSEAAAPEPMEDDRPFTGQVGYYDEENNITSMGIDPVTLGTLLFGAIAFNFLVLANL